jgi:hypothetical protein
MDPRLRPVAAFTFGYLAIALVAGLRAGNAEFLFYIGVMLVLMGLVWAVNRSIEISTGALWALSLWGLAHMAGGLIVVPEGWPVNAESRVLYTLWLIPGRLKYDHIVHAYGFGVTTWVCWQGLRSAIRKRSGGAPAPTFGRLRRPQRGDRVRGHAHDARDERGRVREHGVGPGGEHGGCHGGFAVDSVVRRGNRE